MVAGLVYFDQFEPDLELEFELQDLGLEFELQDPELGFELGDPEPDLWDLVLHHNLTLSIWIGGIRDIWSIHPDLNISEPFPYLKCANFPYMYITLYPSSLQVKSIQQLSLK